MKIYLNVFCLLTLMYLCGCANSGLVRGDVTEIDVKADNWDRKDLVITVQESLKELGYEPGNTNGVESTKTQDAVKQYKIDHKLQVNTDIDGTLERHIDDFIWETRNENSLDSSDYAREIVSNRHHEECLRLLGPNYENKEFPQKSTNNVTLYVYRIHNSGGEKPDYPESKIYINNNEVGSLSHNELLVIELPSDEFTFSEKVSEPLKNKESTEYSFTASPGTTHFIQVSVGKVTTPNLAQTSSPFFIGYGLLDVLIGEIVWDAMNQHKYGKTFHFSNFTKSKEHIGKCHIQLLRDKKV